MSNNSKVVVSGAGPVGCLAACYLAKRGYSVEMYESRPDSRTEEIAQGRSINLALSNRAFEALGGVSQQIVDDLHANGIKMFGRYVHLKDGTESFQAYGKPDQYILSVGRRFLNEHLMTCAESYGVKIHFNDGTKSVNLENTTITTKQQHNVPAQFLIGADGVHSPIRRSLQEYGNCRMEYQQHYMTHGYKELILLPTATGEHALRADSLHIWPREDFMLIALPNPSKDFTVTLFLRDKTDLSKSPYSFENLDSEQKILEFFRKEFPDYVKLTGEERLIESWNENPTSGLLWIKAYPHHYNNVLLIGDAAHAIIPFYGQGVNCGFEDCRVLDSLWDEHNGDVKHIFEHYTNIRKSATDAICELAEYNFVEMAALTASQSFVLKKKIGALLYKWFPDRFIPLYTMVTFSPHISYDVAYNTYKKREAGLTTATKIITRGFLLAALSGAAYFAYDYYKKNK
jgi:kynurenine 3-monooxygenase